MGAAAAGTQEVPRILLMGIEPFYFLSWRVESEQSRILCLKKMQLVKDLTSLLPLIAGALSIPSPVPGILVVLSGFQNSSATLVLNIKCKKKKKILFGFFPNQKAQVGKSKDP